MKTTLQALLLQTLFITIICWLIGCSHPATAPVPLSPSGYKVKTIIETSNNMLDDSIWCIYDGTGRLTTLDETGRMGDLAAYYTYTGNEVAISEPGHNYRPADGTMDAQGHIVTLLMPDDVYNWNLPFQRSLATFTYDADGFMIQQRITDSMEPSKSTTYYYHWRDSCLVSIYKDTTQVATYSYTNIPEYREVGLAYLLQNGPWEEHAFPAQQPIFRYGSAWGRHNKYLVSGWNYTLDAYGRVISQTKGIVKLSYQYY